MSSITCRYPLCFMTAMPQAVAASKAPNWKLRGASLGSSPSGEVSSTETLSQIPVPTPL
jgi:hypothetical protein